jgi:hypothetical protein
VQIYGAVSGGIYNSNEMAQYYEQALKKTDKRANIVIF